MSIQTLVHEYDILLKIANQTFSNPSFSTISKLFAESKLPGIWISKLRESHPFLQTSAKSIVLHEMYMHVQLYDIEYRKHSE